MASTEKVELVETQELALSLKRLQSGAKNGYDEFRWRRALYHALAMSGVCYRREQLKLIREALELA